MHDAADHLVVGVCLLPLFILVLAKSIDPLPLLQFGPTIREAKSIQCCLYVSLTDVKVWAVGLAS
jgi:hypothetical protein